MLGVVFTELLEMVETAFSMEMVDTIIEHADTRSGGSYTAVGKYEAAEVLSLVAALSEHTGIAVPVLLRRFGRHLFGRLVEGHPESIEGLTTSFDLLQRIESHIHSEVQKLYPDAELPRIDSFLEGPNKLTMHYCSTRPLAVLALGLIEGCADHFGETLSITHIDTSDGTGTSATFSIERIVA